MKNLTVLILVSLLSAFTTMAEEIFTVRGLCIAAPAREDVKEFAGIIENELAPSGLNLLVLRIDYNYRFTSHPELVSENPLEKEDVKLLVDVCSKHNIRLIPQINLLGHQSWAGKISKLLRGISRI